jgi:hypothetical protein
VDTTSLLLAVTGITTIPADASNSVFMLATLQTQPLGGSGDKAWLPIDVVRMNLDQTVGADNLWTAQITLPAPRGSRPFRILLEEFELYQTDNEPESNAAWCMRTR